jgi:hypothetical protein
VKVRAGIACVAVRSITVIGKCQANRLLKLC